MADREFFRHSMKIGLILHDMPVESNRVDLDPKVTDAWGRAVARITHRPHQNDLDMADWQIEKNIESFIESLDCDKISACHLHHLLVEADDITGVSTLRNALRSLAFRDNEILFSLDNICGEDEFPLEDIKRFDEIIFTVLAAENYQAIELLVDLINQAIDVSRQRNVSNADHFEHYFEAVA